MNRSTIFDFLKKDSGLEIRYWKIHNGNYPVMVVPYRWDHCFLLINGLRFTDFEVLILYSNELVVKYNNTYDDSQVNIPYRDIEYIEVREYLDIGYMGLHNGDKIDNRK